MLQKHLRPHPKMFLMIKCWNTIHSHSKVEFVKKRYDFWSYFATDLNAIWNQKGGPPLTSTRISTSLKAPNSLFSAWTWSSSFLLTWCRYTGPKWPRSTWQPSFINFRHGTSQVRLHGHFRLVYLLQVSKNDDEEQCFLK